MNKVLNLITKEYQRQNNELCFIASENLVSKDILKACGSVLTNRYSEGYPGKRYYQGNEIIDKIEQYAIDKAKELFKCKWANVQPHSGSQANQAVYLALCNPGDTILGMDLNAGGHLTHGSKVSSSGKLYNSVSYGVDENGIINYEEIKEKLYKYNPKLLIVGASAYPRIIDFERIRKIIDEYNTTKQIVTIHSEGLPDRKTEIYPDSPFFNHCYLMVDMAHIAGLVAAGLHPSPLPYADVVTTTTHKTLRGPRGGIILSNDIELGKKIDKAVFPGIQGGPLDHIIAGKAICFEEALEPSFRLYQIQILNNIRAMKDIFDLMDVPMISGGSDNHLLLLDLRKYNKTGKYVEEVLNKLGIIVNRNAINNDPLPKSETSGIRLGTASVTTRGLGETDCAQIAQIIGNVIQMNAIPDKQWNIFKDIVKTIAMKYPLERLYHD